MKEREYKELTEKEFDSKFHMIKNHLVEDASFEGCMFETYGKELEYVKSKISSNIVWTIIESEDKLYLFSGFWLINRLGYIITEESYKENKDISVNLNN